MRNPIATKNEQTALERALRGEETNSVAPLRRSARLADQLYEKIVGQIVTGTLRMGERLPSESRLCEIFAVSRPVVREAIFRLQADGLVITRHGAGSYVAMRPRDEFLTLAPIGCVADLMRCYEFRIALEGETAFLAAQRRTHDAIAAIDAALAGFDRAKRSKAAAAEADHRFHVEVARASQNDLFCQSLDTLSAHIFACMNVVRSFSSNHRPAPVVLVQREHEAIATAIRSGDAEGARASMRLHIDNARVRFLGGASSE